MTDLRPIRIFGDLSLEVSRLVNQEHDPRTALDLLLHEGGRFPEEDWHITDWTVETAALSGETDRAIATLQRGLSRGLWYPRAHFDEADFDSLRDHPEFTHIVQVCAELEATALAEPRQLAVMGSNTHSSRLAVIVHRNHASVARCQPHWSALKKLGWGTLMPQSSDIVGPGIHVWADRARAVEQILLELENARETWRSGRILGTLNFDRILWGGFMTGADVALRAAFSGRVASYGVIAISPVISSVEHYAPLVDAARESGLRVTIFVGADDRRCYPGATAMAAFLEENGVPVHLNIRPDYTFGIPDDFPAILQHAVDFIQPNP